MGKNDSLNKEMSEEEQYALFCTESPVQKRGWNCGDGVANDEDDEVSHNGDNTDEENGDGASKTIKMLMRRMKTTCQSWWQCFKGGVGWGAAETILKLIIPHM